MYCIALPARRRGGCITLYYSTLYYITLPARKRGGYVPLYYSTLHCIALHYLREGVVAEEVAQRALVVLAAAVRIAAHGLAAVRLAFSEAVAAAPAHARAGRASASGASASAASAENRAAPPRLVATARGALPTLVGAHERLDARRKVDLDRRTRDSCSGGVNGGNPCAPHRPRSQGPRDPVVM